MKKVLILLLFLVTEIALAQNYANKKFYLVDSLDFKLIPKEEKSIMDSCLTLFHKSTNDTLKLEYINCIIDNCYSELVWPKYNDFIYIYVTDKLKSAKEKKVIINLNSWLALYYHNIGYINDQAGDFSKSVTGYNKALELNQKYGTKYEVSEALNYLGYFYKKHGHVEDALNFYHQSLKIKEEIADKEGIATALNNIGVIYMSQENILQALDYFEKSLKLRLETKNKFGMAESYNNIGYLYYLYGNKLCKGLTKDSCNYLGKIKALEFYKKSLKIREEINNGKEIAMSLSNIASIYEKIGDPECLENKEECIRQGRLIALEYYFKALKLREKAHDNVGIVLSYNNIGGIYSKLNQKEKAKEYVIKGFTIAQKLGYPENIKNSSRLLSDFYEKENNGMEALKYYKIYTKMKDSLNNEKTQKAGHQQLAKYEYEKKKTLDDAERSKQIVIEKEAKKKQTVVIYAVSIGLVMVLLFLIMLYNRFKTTQKQKVIIEHQKHLVEEKHKEITDSINYAERIQRSFIATKSLLDENLSEYFVFFKPKDIVSGDFYWAAKLHNDQFALVTADSTGHGVPGAIMSLLNVTSLEKAIESYIRPADILNSTRKTIIERLKKDGSLEGGKDGMDASLCVYDFKNMKLTIAAANNPVWIIRNSGTDPAMAGLEVLEVKPDKMPIGKHDKDSVSFTQQEIALQSGDVIYTLTDGFPDQFGGPNGKKFMSKNLRELLAVNAHLPMQEQKQLLEQTFVNWVGNMEQVDDVTLIGVRV